MTAPNDPAELLRLDERLRQERETFNHRKAQDERWFSLRLRMGYAALVMLPGLAAIAGMILWKHEQFSPDVVKASAATLFVDIVGIVVSVWKVVLNPGSVTKLEPITNSGLQQDLASRLPPPGRAG